MHSNKREVGGGGAVGREGTAVLHSQIKERYNKNSTFVSADRQKSLQACFEACATMTTWLWT